MAKAKSRLRSDDLGKLLATFSNEELDPLYRLLEAPISSTLAQEDRVKAALPDHRAYTDLIASHLCRFGGNSFVNAGRGGGPEYREVVYDVCRSRKVKVTSGMSAVGMEQALLAHLFASLPQSDRDAILAEAVRRYGYTPDLASTAGAAATMAAQAGSRAAGFLLYRTGLQVVNMASRLVIGRGLSFAGNQAFVRLLGVATGPVGWLVSGVWALKDLAAPALRVTTPAVLIIAGTRQAKLGAEELEQAA